MCIAETKDNIVKQMSSNKKFKTKIVLQLLRK